MEEQYFPYYHKTTAAQRSETQYPNVWSNVTFHMCDGSHKTYNLNVSSGIMSTLVEKAASTGWFTFWHNRASFAIRAELVAHVEIQEITANSEGAAGT